MIANASVLGDYKYYLKVQKAAMRLRLRRLKANQRFAKSKYLNKEKY